MTPAQIPSILAFERLLRSTSGSLDKSLLDEHHAIILAALRRATRHAWLTLEITLAGPALWGHIIDSVLPAEGNVFRQQMEALLDRLNIAGLEGENPHSLRRYGDNLRGARQRGLLDFDAAEALIPEASEDDETPRLDELATAFKKAGYPHLARLSGLRSPWNKATLVSLIHFFLHRNLRSESPFSCLAESCDDRTGMSQRALETLARLLDEYDDALAALLNRPEEYEPDATPGPDAEAVDKLLQLGLNSLRTGEYAQAAGHFTAALKLEPGNAVLYAQRGEAYRLQCEYERAIGDFDLALHMNPDDVATLVSRGMVYHLSGEFARAIADCGAAIARNPKNPAAYRTRAAAFAERGERDPAIADLTEAILLAPGDAAAIYQRALIHANKHELERAIADFTRVLELNPNHVLASLHRGNAHLARSEYMQAVADFSEVLRLHPDNFLAFSGRGQAWQLAGDVARAIADYTEALRLQPDNAQVYCKRGILYRGAGDLERARTDFEHAIARTPEFAAALYQRGKIALAQGHFAEAVAHLSEALYIQPNFAVAYLSRALAHDRLGQFDAGLADAAQAIALDLRWPAAYLARGLLYAHSGQYPAAIADTTRAIRLDASFALALQERSRACILHGAYPRALADCNRLIALQPDNAQAYGTRSVVCHLLGKTGQALADHSRTLQLDPKCMLTAVDQRSTQRLADYVDGLHPQPAGSEAPQLPFRIIIERKSAAPAAAETPPAAPELKLVPKPNVNRRKPKTSVIREPAATTAEMPVAAPTETQPPVPEEEVGLTLLQTDMTANASSNEAPAAAEDAAADCLLEPAPESSAEEQAPEPSSEQPVAEEAATPAPEAPPAPAPDKQVDCPICLKKNATVQALPGGRFKCGSCDAVFYPTAVPASAKPSRPKKKPAKRKNADDAESFLAKYRKPIPIALAAAAAVFLLCFIPMTMFGRSTVRVYKAHGKATFAGQPMANASILLHPEGDGEPEFPRPRATVNEDGSFVLGTYGKDDGAPAGEYTLSIQWFRKLDKNALEDGVRPTNMLPNRYANPKTSRLTVHIVSGENELPPISLAR